jgi:hypothetical protein
MILNLDITKQKGQTRKPDPALDMTASPLGTGLLSAQRSSPFWLDLGKVARASGESGTTYADAHYVCDIVLLDSPRSLNPRTSYCHR